MAASECLKVALCWAPVVLSQVAEEAPVELDKAMDVGETLDMDRDMAPVATPLVLIAWVDHSC